MSRLTFLVWALAELATLCIVRVIHLLQLAFLIWFVLLHLIFIGLVRELLMESRPLYTTTFVHDLHCFSFTVSHGWSRAAPWV